MLAQGTPATYPVSLAASYQIAFDRLAADAPAALALLTLAAQLAPEPIPLTLFTAHPDRLPTPLGAAARDPLAFTDLLRLLRQRGLARVEPDSLTLHRLIAAILRHQYTMLRRRSPAARRLHRLFQAILRHRPDRHDLPTVAIRLLRAAVPADPWNNPISWPAWRQLLPHVLAATDTSRALDSAGDDVTWLLNCAGTYLHTRGQPASARPLFERALTLCRRVLGEEHPSTLVSAHKLAGDLRALGRDDEAGELEEWVRSRR